MYIIRIIFLCFGNSQCLYDIQSKFDWLFNTQSRVQQGDWWIMDNKEKATWNINMPYFATVLSVYEYRKYVLDGELIL